LDAVEGPDLRGEVLAQMSGVAAVATVTRWGAPVMAVAKTLSWLADGGAGVAAEDIDQSFAAEPEENRVIWRIDGRWGERRGLFGARVPRTC
jgi:hypothetical protein